MFSIEKWKDLKLEDFYHEKYQNYLRWFMDVTFLISLFLYIFTAFIILTKSPKQMGAFKYTVFTQISCNMLYKLLIFIFNPIFLFPLPIISLYNNYFPITYDWIIPIIGLVFFAIIAAAIAILFSIINRVLAAFETKASKNSMKMFIIGIVSFFVGVSILWTSAMFPLFMIMPELEASWKSLEVAVPSVKELREILPNTFGINPSLTGNLLTSFIIIAISWTFIYTIAFLTLNIIVVYQLQKIKKIVSKTTYSMHKMLHTKILFFNALIIQTVNLVLFAVVPICFLATIFILELPNGSIYANLPIPITSFHLIVDAPALLHFIKPYRKYVLKLISRKNNSVVTFNVEGFSMAQHTKRIGGATMTRRNTTKIQRNLSVIENTWLQLNHLENKPKQIENSRTSSF